MTLKQGTYLVEYQHEGVSGYFFCVADDKQHAIEQAIDAYPDCVVCMVWVCTQV